MAKRGRKTEPESEPTPEVESDEESQLGRPTEADMTFIANHLHLASSTVYAKMMKGDCSRVAHAWHKFLTENPKEQGKFYQQVTRMIATDKKKNTVEEDERSMELEGLIDRLEADILETKP